MKAPLRSTDRLIRPLLRPFIASEHGSSADFSVYEEFSLWGGTVRADFAALNGASRGYEIKSEMDTLSRLSVQRRAYNQVFDYITIVADMQHLKDLRRISPWWGIVIVEPRPDGFELIRTRASSENPKKDPRAVAALLWRDEAMQLLTSFGLDTKVRSKPMEFLVDRLSSELPLEILSNRVRQIIRARGDWLAGSRPKLCDDRSQRRASLLSSRRTPYGSRSQYTRLPS